jgi:hypothetical protein
MIDAIWHMLIAIGQAIAISWMLVLSLLILWTLYALMVGQQRQKRRDQLYVGRETCTQEKLCDDAWQRCEEHDISVYHHLQILDDHAND